MTVVSKRTLVPFSIAGRAGPSSLRSSNETPTGRCLASPLTKPRGALTALGGTASSGVRSIELAFQWSIASFWLEQLGPADEIAEALDPERGHQPAGLLGDHDHVVDDVLGLAREAGPQLGILRRHADRAGVEVADAHHDAAGRDQGSGREADLVGAEQRPDDDVAAGSHLAVGLQDHPGAQAAVEQRLLGLGDPDLPGDAGALDRGERRGAGAAVVAGDDDVVGARLDAADGDRADPGLGGELDRDGRLRVGRAEVVDQLLEILDRVDVVVGRRRDQLGPREREAQRARCTRRPCGRAAGRPRRASRPGRS